jgi:hypothetical protein
MLAIFSLRLAWGLIAALLLLSPAQVNPRFYRTHFLTALGLTAVAGMFLGETDDTWLGWALGGAMLLALLGSIAWMLEGAPAGRTLILMTACALALALARADLDRTTPAEASVAGGEEAEAGWLLADDFTSAAVLGSATTAMLIGHSYLIAPAMSLTPLLRLLGALFASVLLRLTLAGAGLWYWTAEPGRVNLETALWLVPRWGLGFLGPLGLGWMAYETARIRSTQSATGILYVVVIFCFLGELTSQLLASKCGIPL